LENARVRRATRGCETPAVAGGGARPGVEKGGWGSGEPLYTQHSAIYPFYRP